jgi:predicted TPR repeat methyltransferase
MSDTLLYEAQSALQNGRLSDAARLYHELLRTNPRHFEALCALGMIYFQSGQYERAQYLIGEALKLDPLFLDGLCVRGVALANLKRYQEALELFERALVLKPDFVDALSNHATTLLEMGRYGEGLAELDRTLAIDPGHAISWNNRGNALLNLDRYEEALESYDRALAIQPDFPDAQQNRLNALGEMNRDSPRFAEILCTQGAELMRRQRWDEALERFEEALLAQPDFVDALAGRGTVLLGMGRAQDALAAFDAAIAMAPEHAISWNNRGNALAALKRFDEAVESYERALAAQPDLSQAAENRDNALFELRRATRCPPGYMRNLFDNFASHYDETMLEKLGYRAHQHLRTLAESTLPRRDRPWRILDLGCGTGLAGEAFKDLAAGGRLDGIDLAPRMIERARSRGIYDDFILADIETALPAPGPRYDLILAADTMIYLGDLAAIFASVAQRLEPGGFYLFAVEGMPGEGWQQTPMNRFRHSQSYLRDEAARAGLAFIAMMECKLRHEAAEPVPGFAVALQKPLPQ